MVLLERAGPAVALAVRRGASSCGSPAWRSRRGCLLHSVSATDLAYFREIYSAWFVPVPQTAGEALWLMRRMVDAFGLPQFAPPRLDGGLRYAAPWLYAIVAVVGFWCVMDAATTRGVGPAAPDPGGSRRFGRANVSTGRAAHDLSVADADRRGRGRLGVHHGDDTRAHRHPLTVVDVGSGTAVPGRAARGDHEKSSALLPRTPSARGRIRSSALADRRQLVRVLRRRPGIPLLRASRRSG